MKKNLVFVSVVAVGCLVFAQGCAVDAGEEDEDSSSSEEGEVGTSADALSGNPRVSCSSRCTNGKWERCTMKILNRCSTRRGGWAAFDAHGQTGMYFQVEGGQSRTFSRTTRNDIGYATISTNGAECLLVSTLSSCVTVK